MLTRLILVAICVTLLSHLSHSKQSILRQTLKPQTDPDYSGCGHTYQCFGVPDDCARKRSCDVLLKTKPAKVGAFFQVFWKVDSNSSDKYVAVGLSDDNMMGDDSVTIFTLPNGKSNVTTVDQGYTHCENGTCRVDTHLDVKGIDQVKGGYHDGLLVGSWRRAETTVVEKKTFNMKTNKYYILLANGPVDDKGNPKHHTHQSVSKKAVNLEQSSTPTPTTSATTASRTTPTKAASTSGPITSATSAPTTSNGTQTTEAPTASPTKSGSTVSPTSSGNSSTTAEPTTQTEANTTATATGKPTTVQTTAKPGGSAAAITLSLTLAIFVAIFILTN